MKHLLLLCSLCVSIGYAQNINDALFFSKQNINGTARYNAMSGAFGALGGDISAIEDNPAGSAVFTRSVLSVSLMNSNDKNESTYGTLNSSTNTSFSDVAIQQAGGALVIRVNEDRSDWHKVVLAFNYQQKQNFQEEFFFSGRSATSINSYFLNYANGLAFANIQALSNETLGQAYLNIGTELGFANQQAFLGYYGGLIDPANPADQAGTSYLPTAVVNNTVNQEYFYSSNGANSKFNFNLSTQYADILYLGMSLNAHTIFAERLTNFKENQYDATSPLTGMFFNNYLKTTGSGFSAQFGGIVKAGKSVRLGLAYETPTWYVLTDELSQSLGSNLEDVDMHQVNFGLINVFPDYKLRTPGKVTASGALVFGKSGLLSVDYHYRNYGNMQFRPTRDFVAANAEIGSMLQGASGLNVGGEYRVKQFSLRGGYRFEQSPYKDKNIMDDLTGFSLGLGYNFGNTKFDVAYQQSQQEISHQLYNTGLTNRAKIDEKNSAITATVTFSF